MLQYKDGIMGEIIYNKKKYVQDKVPNWDDVCKLVDKAKGPNRTWKKFYEDCDKEISQATFTRITHKQYKKALKQEMMQLIVDNAAKPTYVTMERMLQANGYVDESDIGRNDNASTSKADEENRLISGRQTRSKIMEIILDEIHKRGYETQEFSKRFKSFKRDEDAKFTSQLGFDVMEKQWCGRKPKKWFLYGIDDCEPFYHMFFIAEYDEMIFSAHKNDEEKLFSLIDRYSTIFMQDAYEPKYSRDLMYWFVFIYEETYKLFCDAMDKIKVNNNMSVILVDPDKCKVVDEKMIPRHEGKVILRHEGKVIPSIFD